MTSKTSKGPFINSNIQQKHGFSQQLFPLSRFGKSNDFQLSEEFQNTIQKRVKVKRSESYQAFVYSGQSDEKGKFTGKNKPKDPFGSYEYGFRSNLKESYGFYCFQTKNRYECDYKNDHKNGRGSIMNLNNTIAVGEEFADGIKF